MLKIGKKLFELVHVVGGGFWGGTLLLFLLGWLLFFVFAGFFVLFFCGF